MLAASVVLVGTATAFVLAQGGTRPALPSETGTLWERHGARIALIAAAFLLQSLLIIWLVYADRARRRAEHDSHLLSAELAHANRLATAGELSASIAHEMRQPLVAIVASGNTALNWLSRQQPDLEEVRAAMTRIVTQAHRADDVLKSTCAMFGNQPLRREPRDVRTLLLDVVALTIGRLNSAGATVRTTFADHPEPFVSADPMQLQQVFLNLILNAAEAMGGSSGPHLLRIGIRTDDTNVVITVEDSGPGISNCELEQIFKPFFTTKTDGMGMGLSICRSIIRAHGGSLDAQPSDYGAMFRITLPRVESSGDE